MSVAPLCSWGAPEGQRSKAFAPSKALLSQQPPCVSVGWVLLPGQVLLGAGALGSAVPLHPRGPWQSSQG